MKDSTKARNSDHSAPLRQAHERDGKYTFTLSHAHASKS